MPEKIEPTPEEVDWCIEQIEGAVETIKDLPYTALLDYLREECKRNQGTLKMPETSTREGVVARAAALVAECGFEKKEPDDGPAQDA